MNLIKLQSVVSFLLVVSTLTAVIGYKIPNLENSCHYLDTGKQEYQCQHFNFSQYKDETIDINYDGYIAFTHASTLIFQKCSLPQMPRNYFGAFPRVQNITIVDCEMELKGSLTPSYEVQRILKTINMSGNLISDITPATFQNVKNLQYLDLSRNKIINITGVFTHSENLEQLHLHSNQIKEIFINDFSKSKKLKIINLSGNLLEKIENIFENNDMLTNINLSNNKIQTIDSKVLSELKKLQYFNLSENQIETLPEKIFDNCVELMRLDLQHNKLKVLNENLFEKLTSLTFLSLSDNEISKFGVNNIRDLKKLGTLYIQRNEIKLFNINNAGKDSELFEALPNLVTFDISKNPKSSDSCLDIKLQQLKFPILMRLNLSSTNLCNLTYNSFIHYKYLKWLDLSFNNLKKIDWHTLIPLNNLRELDISGNQLSQFEYNNSKVFTDGLKIQLVANQWNCTYLMNMIKYFSAKDIDFLPPWHYIPKTAKSIAGIECYGEVDAPFEDKAEEVLEDHNKNTDITKIETIQLNHNNKGDAPTVNFDAFSDKLEQIFGEKHVVQVKVHNIDDFRESIKSNFSFFYFLGTVVFLVIIILSVWNFLTIRTLRNLAKIQQRISFEANLLDNIQA